jgi:hypothetical protein
VAVSKKEMRNSIGPMHVSSMIFLGQRVIEDWFDDVPLPGRSYPHTCDNIFRDRHTSPSGGPPSSPSPPRRAAPESWRWQKLESCSRMAASNCAGFMRPREEQRAPLRVMLAKSDSVRWMRGCRSWGRGGTRRQIDLASVRNMLAKWRCR